MFHGFDYPDESDTDELYARFWCPTLRKGVLSFDRPEDCKYRKFVRKMGAKSFGEGNVKSVELEVEEMGVAE
jgi:CRISPR-associated protein Cas5d